jgi:acyl carrier protein
MNRDKIIPLINKIFVDKFELDPQDLTPEKKIFEDLELDSLDIVDLITGIQHTFQIQLRDNKDLLQIKTLQDVYDLVEKIIAEHPEVLEKLEK